MAHVDPTMLDLLRWHGAEEVEHRAVAFDLFQHLDGRYSRRIRPMLVVAPGMAAMWFLGLRFLMANDPTGRRRPGCAMHSGPPALRPAQPVAGLRLVTPYLRRGYHPSQFGSTSQAVPTWPPRPARWPPTSEPAVEHRGRPRASAAGGGTWHGVDVAPVVESLESGLVREPRPESLRRQPDEGRSRDDPFFRPWARYQPDGPASACWVGAAGRRG